MVKLILIFVVLGGAYLFSPQYELYEKEGSFSEDYLLQESGFWSKDDCKKMGRKLTNDYKCKKTNAWQGMLGKTGDYNTERQY